MDLTNKVSQKMQNIYHVHEIETLEELAVNDKGFINQERANTEVEMIGSASQRANVEPRREGKKEKIDKRTQRSLYLKPSSQILEMVLNISCVSTCKSQQCWWIWKVSHSLGRQCLE